MNDQEQVKQCHINKAPQHPLNNNNMNAEETIRNTDCRNQYGLFKW